MVKTITAEELIFGVKEDLKVIFTPEVREYLREVSYMMYKNLIQEIITTLSHKRVKIAPPYFGNMQKNAILYLPKKQKHPMECILQFIPR